MSQPFVLVADDRPADLLTVREVLASSDYELVTAKSGREVLQQLKEHVFAVILLDVHMPDMDGFETAELIRQNDNNHDVPLIFLTGLSHELEQMVRAYHLNAVDFITKPFEPSVLRTKVKILVELYRKTHEAKQNCRDLEATTAQLQEEIARRRIAEEELKRHEDQLESLVAKRTHLLGETTEKLQAEIAERERLTAEVQQLRTRRERQALEHIAQPANTGVTAQVFDSLPLSSALPSVFAGLVERYSNFLDRQLDERTYRIDHDISHELRSLAEDLATLRATPRDMVAIHDAALKSRSEGITVQRAEAYVSEGRLMLLELMGYLVNIYRKYTFGSRIVRTRNDSAPGAANG